MAGQQKWISSQFRRLGVGDQGCQQGQVLTEPSSCLADGCLLAVPAHGREGAQASSSCEEGHSGPFMMAPHSWPPRNLINYERPHLQITSHWGFHTGMWGRHNPATAARTLLTNICTIKRTSNKTVYAHVRRWKVMNKSTVIIKNKNLAVYFYFNTKFLWLELSLSLSPLCPHP